MSEELRDLLTSEFAATAEPEPNAEPAPAVEASEPVEQTEPVEAQTTETAEAKAERIRDEKGKFAKKPDEQQAQPTEPQAPIAEAIERPKTWKKEYLPAWDKIAKGEALTPEEGRKLAAYQTQREKEYQAGITQHKTAADNARHLTDALTPYIPIMQERGMNAPRFIKTLGDTMTFLVKGSPQQKMQALANLANDVGIPLHAIAQTQSGSPVDPVVPQLLQHIQTLESKVNQVHTWREQQEIEAAQNIISKFTDAEKYPHFDLVRKDMGNLLSQGQAKTPEEAYAKAVRLNDEAWEAEQERQANLRMNTAASQRQNPIAKAKAGAVSPKSSAPSGLAGNSGSGEIADLLKRGFAQHVGRV